MDTSEKHATAEAPPTEAKPAKPPRRYSPSVNAVRRRLAGRAKITAWDIVRTLLAFHTEYGEGMGKMLRKEAGPARGAVMSMDAWFEGAEGQLQCDHVPELHGRLLILALARLDQDLEQYLQASRFLDKLRAEIEEPLDFLLVPRVNWPTHSAQPDPAPLHLDDPTADDRLGRRGFARALALRLDRIWNEHNWRAARRSSFIMHIHGPWGAGKTSLLHLLRQELQPEAGGHRPGGIGGGETTSRWVVVNFNAWQHQRLDPPWWPLMDAVYRQASDQIRVRFRRRMRAWWIGLRENAWRFFTGRRDVITVAAILLLAAGVLYWPLRAILPPLALGFGPVGGAAKAVNEVLALVATILSAAMLVGRSLLSGSARAAKAFVESAADPMERVSRHFRGLVRTIDCPLVILIDDLDRCQCGYVVTLLEGIQTLFNDPRVIYVIAADRRWLYACFEKAYDLFAPSVTEPGRRLGSLFLEKAFELSVSVPRLSPELQAKYWEFLLTGPSKAGDTLELVDREAREEFASAETEGEVFERLGRQEDDPIRGQARRQAAVERLASARVEESTSYFLAPFAPLLEPNPRAMKRLLNAYAVHRDLAILAGIDILRDVTMRRRLALWTILCLRWPAVEDYLLGRAGGKTEEPDPDLLTLLNNADVQKVVNGEGIGTPLDLPSIGQLVGLRTSDTTAGAVA
jgi:hypothetical protein